MTVGEAIDKAVATRNAAMVGKICDVLRFRCGLNYDQIYAIAAKRTGISPPAWETLCYMADEGLEDQVRFRPRRDDER